ncbi:hypothetical protein Z043_122860 [Scleropages formosus]|uniref:POU domain protein n=1 Tax=Scleropages formosus TaxID=113540 RepID=A0A0P7TYP2_SCLFO|nr:hypothetical protein Z043_122860 [Scleropages formosus]
MEELEAFAKLLKQKRVALGFTQADLGISLGKLCGGRVFSQTTICRFEALQLSFGNMCALLPVLKRWLAEVEASDNPHELQKLQGVVVNVAKRKNRTSLSDETRQSLENWYSVCPRPTAQQITQLSTSLELHRDVVRVWFCNRRQKGKRLDENSAEEKNQHLAFQYIQCHPQMPQYVEHDQQGLHMQGMTLPAQGFPGSGHPVLPAICSPTVLFPSGGEDLLLDGVKWERREVISGRALTERVWKILPTDVGRDQSRGLSVKHLLC